MDVNPPLRAAVARWGRGLRSTARGQHPRAFLGRIRESGPVKTTRERAEEKRQAKLDFVREQVESGALVIRKMTDEERRRYPPRTAPTRRFGRQ